MKTIFNYLEQIRLAQGGNAKSELVKQLILKDPNAIKFFELVYNDDVLNVSTRSIEKSLGRDDVNNYEDVGEFVFNNVSGNDTPTFEEVVSMIDTIKGISGNECVGYLQDVLTSMSPLSAKWFSRIIVKNLRIGVTRTTINNVLSELGKPTIDKFGVQLCGKVGDISEWTEFPCYAGIKYDGFRGIIEKKGDNITITSRAGKDVDFLPEIKEEFKVYTHDFIIDGECMASNFSEIQKRIGRKAENIVETKDLRFVAFDILKLNDRELVDLTQKQRKELLKLNFIESERLKFEEYIECQNITQLTDFYNKACERKEEGIIIKSMNGKYVYDSRDAWIKVKPYYTYEVRVVGWEQGRGKYKDTVGALFIEDKSGLIKSKVGSGIDDDDRETLMNLVRNNKLNNTIIELRFNEITTKASGEHSFRFPRLIKIRDDKTEADDLSKLI